TTPQVTYLEERFGPDNLLVISAKTGQGIATIRNRISQLLQPQMTNSDIMFSLTLRQEQALIQSSQYLNAAMATLSKGESYECAIPDLRKAHQLLGEITGDFLSPDILDRIFSNFCIGK
ncbi:hypothetical protein JW979_06705, partial [bacterium]|nr:hypothetical protein [candidate division CSSED10-310 bacterium]